MSVAAFGSNHITEIKDLSKTPFHSLKDMPTLVQHMLQQQVVLMLTACPTLLARSSRNRPFFIIFPFLDEIEHFEEASRAE